MAHVLGLDPYHPSLFELVAQDRLMAGLKPALKRTIKVMANRFPRLRPAVEFFDELYLCLLFVLEKHYLSEYDGSFAENFYGLKRVQFTEEAAEKKQKAINARDRSRALYCLVIVPYVKGKLDAYYRSLTEPEDEDGFENTNMYNPSTEHLWSAPVRLLRYVTYRFYPYAHMVYEGCSFIFMLRYLFGFSKAYSLSLLLMGQKIRRLSLADVVKQQQRATSSQRSRASELDRIWESAQHMGLWSRIRHWFWRIGFILADYARGTLLLALFVYKFLEWWYSPDNDLQTGAGLPVPPPPAPCSRSSGGLELPRNRERCALCMRQRTNPTCTPSGFVFCYPCIFEYVARHGICPVSLTPCTTDMLRKIYEN